MSTPPPRSAAWRSRPTAGADIVTGGLQKCLGGPSGSAPITISDRAAEHIFARRHVERASPGPTGRQPAAAAHRSNYFDLAMIMDYWSDKRLNHHTEATTMLYGARECARVVLERRPGGPLRPPRRGRRARWSRAARAWA
jgi:(S)-ureidoglycine-glyoxylate aminotransferase